MSVRSLKLGVLCGKEISVNAESDLEMSCINSKVYCRDGKPEPIQFVAQVNYFWYFFVVPPQQFYFFLL